MFSKSNLFFETFQLNHIQLNTVKESTELKIIPDQDLLFPLRRYNLFHIVLSVGFRLKQHLGSVIRGSEDFTDTCYSSTIFSKHSKQNKPYLNLVNSYVLLVSKLSDLSFATFCLLCLDTWKTCLETGFLQVV